MIRVSSAEEDKRTKNKRGCFMGFNIDLLQDLLNDTTEGKWKSHETKLLISTLTGRFDVYDIQSEGDARFIAYIKNHTQEIIDFIQSHQITPDDLENDPEQGCLTPEPKIRRSIDEFLDEIARLRGEV